MSMPPELKDRVRGAVLVGYRGSIAHGTYRPNSEATSTDDKDLMGLVVAPPEVYYGLTDYGSRGTIEIGKGTDEWDVVLYDVRKGIRLLLNGNPNVLSLLWLPENLYLYRSPLGQKLIENRHFFVGKHVYKSYVGYASSQALKMESGVYRGFMGEKRKSLVEQFGFDTKNASHLIRILRQGVEFLTTGELNVQRFDAAELLAIKRGEWSLERVKEESARLFALAQEAYVRSDLPPGPNREGAEALCIEIVRETLKERGH